MQELPNPMPTMLGRGDRPQVPVEAWHREFHRHLDVLEAAAAIRSQQARGSQQAYEKLARTLGTGTGDADLATIGERFFRLLINTLVVSEELRAKVSDGDTAARARWVWTRRIHEGESFLRVGRSAAETGVCADKPQDPEKWAKDHAWPQGLDMPTKFPTKAAAGLRAVLEQVVAAIHAFTDEPPDLDRALQALIPEELRTPVIEFRTRPEKLTDLQRRAFPVVAAAIESGSSMLLGGPTGCGKTFLAMVAAVSVARKRHRQAIIAVPLKALVRDIYGALATWIEDAGIEDSFRVVPGSRDYPEFDDDLAHGRFDVAVVIYEKLSAYMSLGLKPLDDCGLLVIDELQQLDDVDRGSKIESLLAAVRYRYPALPIMGLSSALHEDTWKQLSTWLKVPQGNQVLSTVRPVPLDVSVTNGIVELTRRGLAPEADSESADRQPESTEPSDLRARALAAWDQPRHSKFSIRESLGLMPVIAAADHLQAVGAESSGTQILIFTRSRGTARGIAMDLRQLLDNEDDDVPHFLRLDEGGVAVDNPWETGRFVKEPADAAAREAAGKRFRMVNRSGLEDSKQLIEAVRTGVGYHTSEVPRLIQQELEREFLARNVRVLVSTKTLAIGVNLPVDIVIVAHLTTHGRRDTNGQRPTGIQLVSVGELRNMIGRAGRLGFSDIGRALITTEHGSIAGGLTDDERELIKSPERLWDHYLAPQDFSTQLRSAMYERPTIAAWLILQTLVSDDFDRTRAFSGEDLEAYIRNMLGNTFAAVSPAAVPVREVREELQSRRLVSQVAEEVWQVSGLGVALAKSGLPLSESTTLTKVAEALERQCGTLDILYLLALGDYLSSQQRVKVRWPAEDRHALADLARRVVSLVYPYTLPELHERQQADARLVATYSAVPALSDRELRDGAALPGDLILGVLTEPEALHEVQINALLQAVTALMWLRGVAYSTIERRVTEVCTISQRQGRARHYSVKRYTPDVPIADVETLTEQMSFVLGGARDLTPLTGSQVERQRVQRLSDALQFGLPSWLVPLSRLKMLALDRERLVRVAHRKPDFEETREILEWPELDLRSEEITEAAAQLQTREEGLREGLSHLPGKVLEGSPSPKDSNERIPFRSYVEQLNGRHHDLTVKVLLVLYVGNRNVALKDKRIRVTTEHGNFALALYEAQIDLEVLAGTPAWAGEDEPTILLAHKGLSSGALAQLDAGDHDLAAVLPERSFIHLLYYLRDSQHRDRDLVTAMRAVSGFVTLDQIIALSQRAGFPAPPPFTQPW